MNNLMIFEGNQVEIITNEKGEPLFEVYSTGMALGYKTSNGYPYKSRIDNTIKNAEISTFSQGVKKYFTEEQLYDFMLEARTDKCKEFRRWVTNEVLPQIRQTGGYIPVDKDMSDTEIMARALLIAQNTIEKKDKLITELQPKADVYDKFVEADTTFGFRELRKELESALGINIKETDLKEVMRQKGWIGKTVKALSFATRNGYMVSKDRLDKFGNHHVQDRFTMKAREELISEYLN